jgi:peptide-methionine (R)-S-oxide reductase
VNDPIPSPDELRAKLTPEQYHVMWEQGTEPPFSGELLDMHDDGSFHCASCGNLLFESGAKYDSGSGWPSFYAPAGPGSIRTRDDDTHGMRRTEVTCARCGGHLGHVFPDGPGPAGERYCMNSLALKFEEEPGKT